ncbi:MAG: hypothetical protein COB41_04190 [Proteobacteria bacterium]|nr:MAG: hypothetical protein COB41_04190 [Pseudomonadota bacterium]
MTGDAITEVKAKLERCWSRGDLCRAVLGHGDMFPWHISLGKPSSKQMLDDFSGTQDWVKKIQTFAQKKQVQLQWQTINHRTLGAQQLPSALCLESAQQAARLVGKVQPLQQCVALYKLTIKQFPALQPWLLKYPLKALALADSWQQILAVCAWMQTHPNPRIYLRQVDVTGVDSKFIEQHKRVLADLFDLILPVYAIDDDFLGAAGFVRRYGFLDKPAMLRLRPLDASISWLHSGGNQDVMMTEKAFARLDAGILEQINKVVIIENEINYLAFPEMDHTLLIFGSGYGFEALKKAQWLDECALYYWGDLDTHGFAILNQLRATFPQAQSFLMDKHTLISHQHAWGIEPKQEKKDLKYLNKKEADMYDDLRHNRLSDKLRLEQERIAFSEVVLAVQMIAAMGETS